MSIHSSESKFVTNDSTLEIPNIVKCLLEKGPKLDGRIRATPSNDIVSVMGNTQHQRHLKQNQL